MPIPALPAAARWALYFLLLIGGAVLSVVALAGIALILVYPQLPSLEVLTDYQPKIPLRIYSSEGDLIGEFGEERRNFAHIKDVPAVMKQAILAAEDERFYQHPGIDTLGVLRAAYSNFIGGGKRQGASTITMQVARNFFLSSEKTLTRKLYEMLLAFKIENNLGKDQILEIYVNQIYLGQRAYGFSAAAQIYLGKALKDVSVAEAAMLAGLPKAPSTYNPVANPKRAQLRQRYVLRRMHELNFIDEAQWKSAQTEALHIKRDVNDFGVRADYVAEMARQIAVERFPEDVYSRGLRVITTIHRGEQQAAYLALRRGVMDFDRRHGYRGAEAYVDVKDITSDQDEELEDLLADYDDSDDLLPAIVLEASPRLVRAYLRGGEVLRIGDEGLKFAARMLDDKSPPNKRLRRGALIRVQKSDKGWQVVQLPDVEAAFVAASPVDGAIRALVGGFDFNRSKFNHVTQAWRQPGSSFKPFIYSAALEKGFTPSTVVNDAPLFFDAGVTGGQPWEPKNYDGTFEGPMTLRRGLAKSKNMISIQILRSIGTQYAQEWITHFGFEAEKHPPYLTMALGAGSVTPMQMATAYSVFANGGYRVNPWLISRVNEQRGKVLVETTAPVLEDAERAIEARNAFLMSSLLQEVTRTGTAARAQATLKRPDIYGKTGTTNDSMDAWFAGFQQTLAAVTWIGYDTPRKLGDRETGGGLSLPVWISFMETALKNVPVMEPSAPEGVVHLGGEWYYDEFAKGAGITGLKLDDVAESGVPAQPPSEEKRQILDLFKN